MALSSAVLGSTVKRAPQFIQTPESVSPSERRQLAFIAADSIQAGNKLAQSIDRILRTSSFPFEASLGGSDRNAAVAEPLMRDWLETHYKSLDRHFIDLLALVSRRLNVDRDKAVLESERLVRTALYTRKARPAATLFDAWRKAAVLGFLPQGIGDDERVLGERLVHFCFRREKEVWEHLARLREDELARIDLLPELGESPAPSERPSPLSIQAKLPAKKRDLSQYLDSSGLTDRQHECASLYFEYNLPITEIARRLGITRKVVDEHIAAAKKKVDHSKLRDQRAANKARSGAF